MHNRYIGFIHLVFICKAANLSAYRYIAEECLRNAIGVLLQKEKPPQKGGSLPLNFSIIHHKNALQQDC